jgi:hypothetical protein
VTDTRIRPATPRAAGQEGPGGSERGFRPPSRHRNRIALGALLAAVAVGGNAWVYSNLDDAGPVVQVVRDVPAGEQITADVLRTTDVDADSTVNLVPGEQLDSLIGRYAKVRLVSGSLITAEAVQDGPLVRPGNAIVAIQVADGTLPIGLRERVPILLVVGDPAAEDPPTTVTGRVVGLPTATTSALGVESLSVEVGLVDAPMIAAADDVRVVLVEPVEDPAAAGTTTRDDDEPDDGSSGDGEP